MFGTILIDDDKAIESLKKVDDKGKTTKTNLQNIADTGAKIGAAVIAGTGVAIGGLMAMANNTSETAAKWLELSQRTDIGIESLERWGYAASQSGADIDKLEVGMKKLSTNIVDATSGTGASRDAFEKLGISMSDLSKMTPEEAFDATMNKLADMPNSAEKNVVGNQLLGKSYTELKTLLSEGSDGMQALKDHADELGIVMSGESVVAAEGFGDTLDNVKATFDGVKNKIVADLLPQLTNMLNWFLSNAPQIQSVAGAALGFISDTIGFIADHSNILIPILGGLLGAIMALQVISVVNGIMEAWKASTIATTLAQGGLNAVLMANPIGLVVAAIAALIAIGIALYMNWDKIKEVAGNVFEKLKEVVGGAIDKIKGFFEKIINFVKDNWQGLLLLIVNPFAGAFKLAYDNCEGFRNKVNAIFDKIKQIISDIVEAIKTKVVDIFNGIKTGVEEKVNAVKTTISNIFGAAKDLAISIFENLKTGISEKINLVKTAISTVFGTIKDIMSKPFESARDLIKGVIDKIKGFLNFNWEFPKLKMPHFSISGSMNPLKWIDEGVPKLSVDWYAKGGIFDRPTIFNTPYGLKGVGDATSPEVVAPLSDLKAMLADTVSEVVASNISGFQSSEQPIIIESTTYFGDDKVYQSVKRAKLKEDRRYKIQETY